MSVVVADGLAKRFGDVRALDGLDLRVERGEIFGFLGPNGAGKSTTIRILVDLIRPTSGRVEVFGLRPHVAGPEIRSRVGYLPGDLLLPGRRTGRALLTDLARLRGGAGRSRIEPLAERFRLDLDRPIRALSKGNRQKVGLIQVLMHEPELLILDEPTAGLDPLIQHDLHDLLAQARDAGATVFLSSHVLSEVEAVADRVGIIREGRLVDLDDVAELRHRAGQTVELRFAQSVDRTLFTGISGLEHLAIADSEGGGSMLTCSLRGEPDELLKAAARYRVVGWSAADRELEDLFLDRYRSVDGDSVEGPTASADRSDGPRDSARLREQQEVRSDA